MSNNVELRRDRNRARASLKVGSLEADMEVEVTPKGLVAIGFLVSAILISGTPIILVARAKLPPR